MLRLSASLLVLAGPVFAQTVSVVDATEKVYQGDAALPSPSTQAVLSAAQNEFEGFQIVVAGPATNVSLAAGALAGPGTAQIAAANVRIYREAFIALPASGTQATDAAAKEGNAPDALVPQVDEFYGEPRNAGVASVAAGQNAVFFVDIQVPQAATAGVYRGAVAVNASGVATSVPVTLTVWPFALPSTPTLKTVIPFDWDAAIKQYPSDPACCGAVDAQMHLLHALMGVNHRVTIDALDYGSADLTAYKANFGAYIDGAGHTLLPGAKPTVLRYGGTHGATNTLAAWRSFFLQNGWLDRLVDYAADEPAWGVNSTWCSLQANAAGDAANGVRTMTTAQISDAQVATCSGTPLALANINVFVPNVDQVQPASMPAGQSNLAAYATWLSGSRNGAPNEVWEYQSCDSWGCTGHAATGWPSYAIDHPAIRNRALEWISFRNGITGELYWAASSAWVTAPATPWTVQFASGGQGDGTLLYPGAAANAQVGGTHDVPIASLRLKMIREGVEDYEYLSILRGLGDGAYADAQVDGLFPSADATAASPQALYAARQAVACRIVTDQHPTWTCDPATWGTGSTATCTATDCFARPDSATLGGSWNTVAGALQIAQGEATDSLAGATAASVWQGAVGSDQDVSADCKLAGPGSNCGVMARWSDASDFYYAYLDSGMGAVGLWRVQAGVLTQLGSAARSIAAGAWYNLRLVAQGSALSVYFNDEPTPCIGATDSGLASGAYGGLHAYGGAAQAVWYGSFTVKALPPPDLFSIAVSPAAQVVQQGGAAAYAVTTAVTSGKAQPLSLSVSGLPAGAAASFNPATVTAGASSTLTVTTSSATPAGSAALTIGAAGASAAGAAAATLSVQAPIFLRGKTTRGVNSTHSLSLAAPTSTAPGDLLIATLFVGERSGFSVSAPSGWTLVRQVAHGASGTLAVYTRAAMAGDAGRSWTWTSSLRVGAAMSMLAYAGASQVEVSAAQDDAAAGATYATPAIATAASGDLLVAVHAGAAQSWPPAAWSAPAGMTQRASAGDGSLLSLSQADMTQAAPGAAGPFSASASRAESWALTALLALQR